MKRPGVTLDQLKYGVKLTVAAVVAYLLTQGGRERYAFYSVLAAVLVIGSNLGENLSMSYSRVVGTLLGAGVGALIGTIAALSVWSLAAACLLPALASYAVGAGPAARIAVTVSAIVMLIASDAPGHYSAMRALNTVYGAAVGLAVSALVWPVRAKDEVATAADKVLLAAADLLDGWKAEDTAGDSRRARRHLFDELPPLLKARQDERWEARLWGNDVTVGPRVRAAAGVGINVLNASLGFDHRPADLDEATRDAVDRSVATLSARLRDVAAGAKLGIEGVADPWNAVERLTPSDAIRSWLMSVFLALRAADSALIELARIRGLL